METIVCERSEGSHPQDGIFYRINGANNTKIVVKAGVNRLNIWNCHNVVVNFEFGCELEVISHHNLKNCKIYVERPMGKIGQYKLGEEQRVTILDGDYIPE